MNKKDLEITLWVLFILIIFISLFYPAFIFGLALGIILTKEYYKKPKKWKKLIKN